MNRQFWGIFPVLFLLFPFLFLVWHFPLGTSPDWAEIRWAAINSFLQAAGSATVSLVLGLWGAMGLLCFSSETRKPWRSILEMLLLTPNFLPPIFILIAALNLVDPFPMGIPGIIFVHTLMNWGLIAVLLASLIEEKVGGIAELSLIEGSSRWNFLRQGFLPLLRRDLIFLWLFVFALCFGSFGIPLVVGGGRGTTLEVLIYEKIRLSTDWGQAVVIALLQSLFLFALSWAVAFGRATSKSRPARMTLIQLKSGVALILVVTALLLLGYLQGFASGWSQSGIFHELSGDLFMSFVGSLVIGLLTGGFCLLFLFTISFLLPSRWLEKFMSGYVAPSSALTSFAFLVLTPNESFWPYLKIPLAISLVTLATLWRMGWQSALEGLRHQQEMAETLGSSKKLFIQTILIPQLVPLATTLAGLSAVWACGDFAISRILAHRDLTLALMTETLITSGYRLGLATLLSPGILVAGAICFLAMKGVARVLARKPLL